MPEKKTLICVKVSQPGPVVPGNLKVTCSRCHQLVWISPNYWNIAYDNPGNEIVCTDCANSAIEGIVSTNGPSPAQIDEMTDWLKKARKNGIMAAIVVKRLTNM